MKHSPTGIICATTALAAFLWLATLYLLGPGEPKAIPIYPNATNVRQDTRCGYLSNLLGICLETTDTPEKVKEFYRQVLTNDSWHQYGSCEFLFMRDPDYITYIMVHATEGGPTKVSYSTWRGRISCDYAGS